MADRDKATRGGRANQSHGAEFIGANSEIGRKLRQYYDGIVADDIPDRFTELLARLEHAEPLAKKE